MRLRQDAGWKRIGLAAIVLLATGLGCGPQEVSGGPGQTAFLTVWGERNVFLDSGARQTLMVKYHDQFGQPLAGEISFKLDGYAGGSNLSKTVAGTDLDGLARVEVLGGTQAEASFRVVADAALAASADWRVAVAKPAPEFAIAGLYSVESHFELNSGIPGGAGEILSAFLEMTDDPLDPATYLIDRTIEEADLGPFEFLVEIQRPNLDWKLNQMILARVPDFVPSLITIGDRFGELTRRFGLISDFTIFKQNGVEQAAYSANHTVTGVILKQNGLNFNFGAADLQLGAASVWNVPVSLEGDYKVVIGDHTLPFDYGKILLFALNNVVIPSIDPFARSVNDLLANKVDCQSFTGELSYDTGAPAGLLELGCRKALGAVAQKVQERILAAFGAPTTMTIHGDARPVDTNGDRVVDVLQTGLWEGRLQFGAQSSALAKPDQRFFGQRAGLR